MRWVCPRCHNQVPVALTECPYCAPDGPERVGPPRLPLAPPPPAAAQRHPDPRSAPAEPRPDSAEGASPGDAASLRAGFRRVTGRKAQDHESAFARGLEMGIGFMLAVALILFLLALLMTWFFREGWQPWLDQLWP